MVGDSLICHCIYFPYIFYLTAISNFFSSIFFLFWKDFEWLTYYDKRIGKLLFEILIRDAYDKFI